MDAMAGDGPLTLAGIVRRLRRRAGLTQEELAERAGLTVNTIGALERGQRRRLYPHTARALADALGLDDVERAGLTELASGRVAAAAGPPAAPVPAAEPSPRVGASSGDLPVGLTSFIGRERELTATALLLAGGTRLLTLTGPGGSGKTRLALAAAERVRDSYPDGVYFVDLSPVTDPGLVAAAIARALGVRESGSRPVLALLGEFLRARRTLLLLDNFEQVVEGAPLVSALLQGCPALTALVTSRVALRVSGEREYGVPPLPVPDPVSLPGLAALAASPAVALFVQRASAVRPDFALTDDNAAAVVGICARVDGLPLALELAAARVRALGPGALLERLAGAADSSPLRLLAGGARDLPARQQTLGDTIAWSYDLLDPQEQALFRRLAVFVGGWTLEAAESVCAGDGIDEGDVLELLDALVGQSLVVAQDSDGGPRYRMLETIREYALERLTAAGEDADARSRHLASFARLAITAAPKLEWGAEQLVWLRRLERERDNLHAALAWAAAGADLAAGQRLAAALWRFWWQRGLMAQGRRWLDWALSLPAAPSLRAKLLQRAGQFAYWSGDMPAAQASLEASLTIYRELDDTTEIAWTMHRLGLTIAERGEPARGLALCEESIALCRTLDDARGLAYALQSAGNVARMGGDRDRPEVYAAEALALCRASRNQLLTPYPLRQLMVVALTRGDDARARAIGEEALALAREIEDPHAMLSILTDLLRLARRQSNLREMEARGREGLSVLRRVGANQYAEAMLEMMAWAASERGEPERATVVLGAASALRRSSGVSRDVLDRTAYDETLAAARAATGEERFAAAWARGQSLALSAAIAEALPPAESASEWPATSDAAKPVVVAPAGEFAHASARRRWSTRPGRPNSRGSGRP
jgi:predicted ATPase/transcriptional regulator with XRE-family HTH domain